MPNLPSSTGQPAPTKLTFNGYFEVAAWAIGIGLLILISKTKIGYTFLFFFFIVSAVVVSVVYVPTLIMIMNTGSPASQ